ncbi:MAG: response regulator [Lachnospiraceae bacterium]|nr:response regulator [Lachnospiraceae bacterium]
MISNLRKAILKFYKEDNELEVTLFKLLGTAGILVSIIGSIQSFLTLSDYMGVLINLLAALASACLIGFVHATKKYTVGYIITTVCIFMGLFTWLFMEMGGLNGSMPYFFAFGIIFTALMYKGVLLYLMEVLQIVYYAGVCVFGYRHPEYITQFDTAEAQFADQLVGILFSSIGIAVIFLFYIAEYRKQQRVAEESSKAKSTLLANISHEVRTPINMLLGMNEMIMRESEDAQINEYAQNVDNAGQHLLFMVNQFLDLSRIDMGKEVLFEEDFNIMKMIQSLGIFFGKEAEKKGLEFVMDIDKKIPEVVLGDMRKLSQIVSNLLTNAVKYTSKGTIVFTVQDMGIKLADNDSAKDVLIHFEVSDTGNGIAEEDQKKIFESFERVDLVKNRSIEGTGLGLAISNKLANLMGSEIKVRSKYGVGSVFWFDVVLKTGNELKEGLTNEVFFIAPEAKILAVDDNDMNNMVIKSLLKRTMVKVDTAGSAEETYEKYGKKDYDMVIMDYMMPNTNGVEAMEVLRKMDAERNRHVPMIVLTADASPDKKEMFLSKGFDDYLLKPIDSFLLESDLRKYLPSHMISLVNEAKQDELPMETRLALDRILKKHDISLKLALKHLSGDILQFSRVCEYFVKDSQKNIEEIKAYINSGDYENAALLVHALKGNAGNVGGEDLYYTARRLEKRIKDGDSEYTVSALPLFIMQWKRVEKGLKEFLIEFEKVKPSLIKDEDKDEKINDETELWKALMKAVQRGKQTPALKLADSLTAIKGEDEALEKIKESIRNIEFHNAESIINGILNNGKGGS